MKKATVLKENKVMAEIVYDEKKIENITGPEADKMKRIFSEFYPIAIGGRARDGIMDSAMSIMKPSDEGYVDAVLLNIIQLKMEYEIRVRELKEKEMML